MSGLTKCPKCGNENPSSAQYCAYCGNALATTVRPPSNVPLQIPVYPGSFSSGPIDHALERLEPDKRKSVYRTRSGIFLIFVGIVMGPIPAIAFYAGLSQIAGAVLVFLGRRALGVKHQRYASLSFILIIGGVVAAFVGSFVVGVLLALAIIKGGDPVSVLSSFFLTLYLLLTLIDAFIGLGLVFFTYDLQNATGRAILWAAYSLGISVDVIVTLVIFSQVQAVSTQVVSQVGTVGDALALVQYTFAPWRLLQLIPAIPYAIAYYRAWSRVDKRATLETGLMTH